MSDRLKGNVLLLITAMAWGSGFVARKLGNAEIPPITFNGLRLFVAAIVMLPFVLKGLNTSNYLSRDRLSIQQFEYHRNKVIAGGIICGLIMTFASTFQSLGLATVSAGKSGFITSMYVVLTPLFGLALGNRLKIKNYICVAVAVVGFAFMSLTEGITNVHIGDWFLLASAACSAAQIHAINKYVDKGNALLLTVIEMAICGGIELIFAIPIEQPTLAQFGSCIPALAYSVLVPSALGYACQMAGQKHASPTSAALILSLESVFSVLSGALILHERMLTREILGCILIFAAVIANQVNLTDIKRVTGDGSD